MALADTVQIAEILMLEGDLRLSVPQAKAPSCAAFTLADYRAALEVAQQLESLQGRLHAIAERDCNGYHTADYSWDQAASDRADRNREKLEAKVHALLAPYGVKVKLGGDPRGSAIKLQTPKSGRHNTWGGASDGWAI